MWGLEDNLGKRNEERANLDREAKALKDSLRQLDNRLQLQRQKLEGDKSKLKLLVDMENS